ncbi:MAG TPA: dTDP-glucose 4,6-dehydratase [Fluviicola sp.]|nr:dTDP-glucose 4,6-dehydratase [Fluviicola sp.]
MKSKRILITGGAGFIGSHLVRLMATKYPDYQIITFDALTYAGNLANLSDVMPLNNHQFVKGDITNEQDVKAVFDTYQITDVIHLAAESHVDRSIEGPMDFVKTNVVGTVVLMNQARASWQNESGHVFYHVSTDEVYGSLGSEGFFTEQTPYDPRSPYSASKAASDHFVSAYYHTYNFPIKRSNCSNNYGSHHHPEKLIPLMIHNIIHELPLPVYGEGINVRDWLWVEDHAKAIDCIFHKGAIGCNYNVGGWNEWKNIDLVRKLCAILDQELGRTAGTSEKLITFVKDRSGHDLRYAIDASKLYDELGWKPSITFEEGLVKTVRWYLDNQQWIDEVISGSYKDYYSKMYSNR